VLGQSGDAVFEKHYQSQFIGRDLQHVVLLRPSQEGLLRFAGSMLRKRDVHAPSELTDMHKRAICQNPDILQLRREKRELMAEMRSLAGTIKNARISFPHLHQKHEDVKKELARLRKRLATDTREAARKDHFQNAPVLEIDRQIRQLLGGSDEASNEASDDENSGDESWELPKPKYVFAERARLVENFYGPDAETFDDDKLLARRIQVTKDMVALLQLCEPNRRGNRVNWNIADEYGLLDRPEESPVPEEDKMKCATDVCIICCGLSRQSSSSLPPHKFPSNRPDSLRRHLIDTHLAYARGGISCNWEECRNVPHFSEITGFLAHAHSAHSYDVNLKLCHLPQDLHTNRSDVSSREESLESESRQKIETPASSVELEMRNIDPRLLEAHSVSTTKYLASQSDVETPDPSGGSVMENSHPSSVKDPIRRSTRGTTKLKEFKPVPEPGSKPQNRKRSFRRNLHAKEHSHGKQRGNKKPTGMKAPKTPLLRRSKRLRAQ